MQRERIPRTDLSEYSLFLIGLRNTCSSPLRIALCDGRYSMDHVPTKMYNGWFSDFSGKYNDYNFKLNITVKNTSESRMIVEGTLLWRDVVYIYRRTPVAFIVRVVQSNSIYFSKVYFSHYLKCISAIIACVPWWCMYTCYLSFDKLDKATYCWCW